MKTLAVVATPHVGTLDSWLPVIAEAKEQHPDWEVLMVLPRPERVARTLNPDDAALKALEGISDGILVFGLDGRFYSLSTLHEVSELSRSQWRLGGHVANLPFLRGRVGELEPRLSEGLRDGRAQWVYRKLVQLAFFARYRRHRTRRSVVESLKRCVVCTDFTKIGRGPVAVAMEPFSSAARLSIEHGLGQGVINRSRSASEEEMHHLGAVTAHLERVYCYSDQMARSMQTRFGVSPDQLAISGIPRHDGEAGVWRRKVASGSVHEGPVVAVMSHTTTSRNLSPASVADYLPGRFKQMMLREVHAFCATVGATMLVRLHPSELRSQSIEEIEAALSEGGSSGSWAVTNSHPSELAASALLAVTFSSALKVEFVAFGVPVIDLSPGPPTGICPEALAGLAMIAHDVSSLRLALARIVADRDRVLREQQAAYRKRYADPAGAVARILQDIEALLYD